MTYYSNRKEGGTMSESIYEIIKKEFQCSGVLPYEFQDLEVAGAEDVNELIWGKDELSNYQKERISLDLINKIKFLIKECTEDIIIETELVIFLKENPIYKYIDALNRILSIHIEEGYFDKEKIYNFGLKLATKSINIENTKLGIIILGNFENDFSNRIIATLGYHSEFTLYAVEVFRKYDNRNKRTYDLVKNTDGYGKLISIMNFYPIHDEQKRWIFENFGVHSSGVKNDIAIIIMENTLMCDYILNISIDEENFNIFSLLLAHSSRYRFFSDIDRFLEIIKKYLFKAYRYAKTYTDLLAIALIRNNISYSINMSENKVCSTVWNEETKKEVLSICEELLEKFDFQKIIFSEIIEENRLDYFEDVVLLVNLVVELFKYNGFLISSQIFEIIFDSKPFIYDLVEFLKMDVDEQYIREISTHVIDRMPDDVFEGENISGSLGFEILPDIWLVNILESYRENEIFDEELLLMSLKARFNDVRIEAIKSLGFFKNKWSEKVEGYLLEALKEERDDKIVEDIKNILGI